ncbi:MAG: hypothetical protein V3U27_04835, partial [Candidatus Tectomicrobia bacterium]
MPLESIPHPRPAGKMSLAQALSPQVVRRALLAAVLVGSFLVLLNQGDLIFTGQITTQVIRKSLLT